MASKRRTLTVNDLIVLGDILQIRQDLASKADLIKRGIAPEDAAVLSKQGLSSKEINELLRKGRMLDFIEYCQAEDAREALENEPHLSGRLFNS